MFPILFVTVACGAVSGFHSLVSSGTSSKTVANEKDMLKVGYGAIILEAYLLLSLFVLQAQPQQQTEQPLLVHRSRFSAVVLQVSLKCLVFQYILQQYS